MICILGESACGKSTVEKLLVENFNYKNIVSYTTRPKRAGEENGKDYYFINNDKFKSMIDNNELAEYTNYNGWYYGTAKKDCTDDKIVVINPHGLRQIKNHKDLNICSFYIKIPRKDRLIKALFRGDNIEEAYRRNVHDDGQFTGIESEVDFVIENPAYQSTAMEIAYIIDCNATVHNARNKRVRSESYDY